MSVACLKKEIEELQSQAGATPRESENHLCKLFDLFRQIEASLAACTGTDEEAEAKRAALIDAQTVVMRTAAVLPARSMTDLLYKLALWRWDSADLDQPLAEMNRKNAVAYSAFRDLAKILGDTSLFTDFDKAN